MLLDPQEGKVSMRDKSTFMLLLVYLFQSLILTDQGLGGSRGLKVAVIAPSVSTSMEARATIRQNGWSETSLREADVVLVVVRSMLFNPLGYSYESIGELKKDAEMQLNISGEHFHVYLYDIADDLAVTQLKHVTYKA
jgi:hypothetical protein